MKKSMIISAVSAACAMAQAEVIVSWGPTNGAVSVHQDLTVVQTFTDAAYQSPTVGGDYDGSAVANPYFYAAVSAPAGPQGLSIWNGANTDLLGRYQGSSAAGTTDSLMLAWDVTNTHRLESFSLFGVGEFGGMTGREVRWLLQDRSGDWYASVAVTGFGNNADLTTADVTTMNWFAFSPHNEGVVTIGETEAAVDFTGVQKVGFYHQWETDGGGGIYQTGFEVSVVPEPATFGLVMTFGSGVFFVRRRFMM
ncbi:PEP-CTERM sorting domain-containing protein [Verrucomicrobia bacterium S94]|nr:PEP-CTERM sorting domain-containing protein [Verrucomicrobia bacterium S94]